MEIPAHLSHLPTYRGFPVPFTTYIDGDKPDFRVTDMAKLAESISERRCAICGLTLGYWCFFIGGPNCFELGKFRDGPMHKECAEFSASVCPFITGDRRTYSTRPIQLSDAEKIASHAGLTSATMVMGRARSERVELVFHGDIWEIYSGPLLDQQQIGGVVDSPKGDSE